ncbi:M15 family metallopeptidase [Marivirga lumbricoides]|uniref:M15 family metallopeptidase n=1 Tax=Marivirga lumbricoides TaxID=1046115 RepID=UPI003D2FEB94
MNSTQNALNRLGNTGFFNIENKLVNYFLDSQKINWGGNWNTVRDWMHFQPTSSYLIFD